MAIPLRRVNRASHSTGSQTNHGRPARLVVLARGSSVAVPAVARSMQEAGYAVFTRIVLTLTGAFAATFTVALLDAVTGWQGDDEDVALHEDVDLVAPEGNPV